MRNLASCGIAHSIGNQKFKIIMKKSKIGILISIIGLFIMGFSIGNTLSNGENNLGLTFGGLFIIFIGVFMVIFNNNKNEVKNKEKSE